MVSEHMRKIVSLEIHSQKFSFLIKRICHTDNQFRLQLFSHEAYGPIKGAQNIVRKLSLHLGIY